MWVDVVRVISKIRSSRVGPGGTEWDMVGPAGRGWDRVGTGWDVGTRWYRVGPGGTLYSLVGSCLTTIAPPPPLDIVAVVSLSPPLLRFIV